MGFKRILILTCLMAVVLTMGCVSASDDANQTMADDVKIMTCETLSVDGESDLDVSGSGDVTVSFNSTGGEGEMENVKIDSGSVFKLPESRFSKANRTFYGWNVGDSIKRPGENLTLTDNLTIKAVWRYDTDLDDNTILRKKEAIYSVDLSQVWADGWL